MEESFQAFLHQVKPHPGQIWVAERMRDLLADSKMTSKVASGSQQQCSAGERILRRLSRNPGAKKLLGDLAASLMVDDVSSPSVRPRGGELTAQSARLLGQLVEQVRVDRSHEIYDVEPIQDRYSVRCLPQYLGPVKDGLTSIVRQIEVEANSANDNPLVDGDSCRIYHGGNFLGQYTSVGMDQLRYYIGLIAKHLDTQISLLVAPEFSEGLPPSLVGNLSRSVNMGFKGLQLSANSMMPILCFLGNPIADRYPTHAEQFNQNVSSQSFASANLARQSVDTFRHYLAICLMFAVQAVDLRTRIDSEERTCDAREYLSSATSGFYESVREVIGVAPTAERPYILDDDEQCLDEHIARIVADLKQGETGRTASAVKTTLDSLRTSS
jgi:phenylalanine ammonia-lyase